MVSSMKLNRSIRMARLAASAGALAALSFLVLGTAGCNKLKARDLINKGVASFKNGKYDDAVEDFKKARDLNPDLVVARVYLATAYANQYIPGAPSEENIKRGNQAIAEFQDLLQKDPNNLSALDGIGSLLFNMAASPFNPQKFEESKSYHERHIQLKPGDPEPYYWVGVIDWTLAYRANAEMRADYNKNNIRKQVKDTDPLPAKVREQYSAKYSGMVEEGIKNIKEAVRLRPEYEDAITYLNLLYRRKADMVQAEQEREALLKQADDLMEKVKVIKQKKLEAPPQQSS